jgi:hypothetical protein
MPPADLPLDDRSNDIKFSYHFVAFFSTLFVVLRLWNDIRTKKRWYSNTSDWLLAFAQVSDRSSGLAVAHVHI